MVSHETTKYLDMIIKSGEIKYKQKNSSVKKIRYLYDLLDNAKNIIERNKKKRKININRDIVGKELIKIPLGFNSYFFPEIIKSFILEHQRKQLIYSFNINKRSIKVYFTLLCEDDIIELYEDYITRIIEWLYICDKYSNNCGKILEIFIYQTEFKKELSVDIIGPVNVNSGFSTSCARENEIVIYRKEEWFKVFVHETFHAYGFDIDHKLVEKYQDKVKKMFSINKGNLLLGETYSEVWARIINILFNCYLKTRNYNDFKISFIFSLEIERIFGIIQSNKVLKHYGLSYVDIICSNNNEMTNKKMSYLILPGALTTNTFCYYILSSLIMQDPYNFLDWCCRENTQWLRFNNHEETIEEFINLLHRNYKKDRVIELFNKMYKYADDNELRMTLIDIYT
jgi:hypothetical protein